MMDEDFEKKVTKRMAECAEAAVEELAARGEFIKCDSLCDAEAVAVRCAKLALVRFWFSEKAMKKPDAETWQKFRNLGGEFGIERDVVSTKRRISEKVDVVFVNLRDFLIIVDLKNRTVRTGEYAE